MITREYTYGNATIIISRPDNLRESERKKREDDLKLELERIGKAMEDSKWRR